MNSQPITTMTVGPQAQSSRKRVYVAGPITKEPYNGPRNALIAADRLLDAGHFPYVPHLTVFWALSTGEKPYEQWLELDFAWIETCEALVRIPGDSPGSDREVAHARSRGIPVYFSVDEFLGAP